MRRLKKDSVCQLIYMIEIARMCGCCVVIIWYQTSLAHDALPTHFQLDYKPHPHFRMVWKRTEDASLQYLRPQPTWVVERRHTIRLKDVERIFICWSTRKCRGSTLLPGNIGQSFVGIALKTHFMLVSTVWDTYHWPPIRVRNKVVHLRPVRLNLSPWIYIDFT